MKYKYVICQDFDGSEMTAETWAKIDGLCVSRVLINGIRDLPLKDRTKADCLLVKLGAKVTKHDIDSLPNLRYIGMLGTGYGGIDTAHASSQGIAVTSIADYATEAVAEFTFAILLEHWRDIARAKTQAGSGDYSDNFAGAEIRGKRLGVIGMGNIGQRTAMLAQAFGADVCYWSRHRKEDIEELGIKYSGLDALLTNSDIITLNLALNPETAEIINAERLRLLKPGAVFINLSPMELIDFKALLARLRRQDITFMLDHSDELAGNQLRALRLLNNCIIYPPIAYLSREAGQIKQLIFVDNLANFLAGKPTNKVN